MAVLKNRAKMSTSTTGTGTITLGSAEDGYQTFADAGVANADVVRYVIEDGSNFEIGTGTYTSSGTTLSRTVSESSNSNNAINLSGSATVFIGATAEDIPALYADNYDGTSTKPTATGTNSISIGRLATASGTTSFAAGNGAEASGLQSVSIGYQHSSNPTGEGAANYGRNSNAAAPYSTAIGANSAAAGSNSFATALTKSYASGASSFAAAIDNNTSSYGATGANSIAIGQNAKATNGLSVGLGYGVNASAYGSLCVSYNSSTSGNYSSVLGGISSTASATKSSVVNGDTSLAGHTSSTAIGPYSTTRAQYAFAFGGQSFDAQGAGQASIFNLVSDTTDATAEAMTTNKSTASTNNQVILPNSSAYAFHGTIVARQQAADGTACAAWKVEGLIRREANAGTTVLVNSATTVLDNTPNWGMALSADTTNGGLAITCTGAASTDIRWVATITTSEVTYA